MAIKCHHLLLSATACCILPSVALAQSMAPGPAQCTALAGVTSRVLCLDKPAPPCSTTAHVAVQRLTPPSLSMPPWVHTAALPTHRLYDAVCSGWASGLSCKTLLFKFVHSPARHRSATEYSSVSPALDVANIAPVRRLRCQAGEHSPTCVR